jgi:hypothetical protein
LSFSSQRRLTLVQSKYDLPIGLAMTSVNPAGPTGVLHREMVRWSLVIARRGD